MKIALAQINTATGDLDGNEKKIRQYLEEAVREKADLVIFPELTLVGYPPRDILFQHGFLDQANRRILKLAKLNQLLEEGEVLASGTHELLMDTCPEYVQIFNSQRSTNHYEL